jgi:hypothetical protein
MQHLGKLMHEMQHFRKPKNGIQQLVRLINEMQHLGKQMNKMQ